MTYIHTHLSGSDEYAKTAFNAILDLLGSGNFDPPQAVDLLVKCISIIAVASEMGETEEKVEILWKSIQEWGIAQTQAISANMVMIKSDSTIVDDFGNA